MGARITPIVKYILIVNLAIFMIMALFFPYPNDRDIIHFLGLHHFYSRFFFPTQLLTHMFTHGGIGHIFGNMFALFIFGPILESLWGSNKFLTFYMATGIMASLFYLGVESIEIYQINTTAETYMTSPTPSAFQEFVLDYPNGFNLPEMKGLKNTYEEFARSFYANPGSENMVENSKLLIDRLREANVFLKTSTPLVGASGAVFGVLAAFALLFPNMELMLLFFPFPIKAKYLLGGYILLEIYASINDLPGDNVAHLAHVGGALIGFIFVKYWHGNNRIY